MTMEEVKERLLQENLENEEDETIEEMQEPSVEEEFLAEDGTTMPLRKINREKLYQQA